MSFRRMQGWALIVSAMIQLLSIPRLDSPFLRILFILGAVLLIVGVPAIEAAQRSGWAGVVGIVLIELAAIIALILIGMALAHSGVAPRVAPGISALAGALGRVIVGWLTTRRKVFPAWAGWAFIAEGVLNFLGGIIATQALAPVLGVIVPLTGMIALFGYGWTLARGEASAPLGGRHRRASVKH